MQIHTKPKGLARKTMRSCGSMLLEIRALARLSDPKPASPLQDLLMVLPLTVANRAAPSARHLCRTPEKIQAPSGAAANTLF
jgi:hypothetical protein